MPLTRDGDGPIPPAGMAHASGFCSLREPGCKYRPQPSMRQHRQLLALLLAVVYAVASTLGVAFVICVEDDGKQSVEALGSSCCRSVAILDTVQTTLVPRADKPCAPDTGDCGRCDDRPLVSLHPRISPEPRPELDAKLRPSLTSTPHELRDAPSGGLAPPHDPWAHVPLHVPPQLAMLRSVILRC